MTDDQKLAKIELLEQTAWEGIDQMTSFKTDIEYLEVIDLCQRIRAHIESNQDVKTNPCELDPAGCPY